MPRDGHPRPQGARGVPRARQAPDVRGVPGLWIAARTDPELHAILKPAQEAFEQEWYRTAVDLFPEWRDAAGNFDLALDLVHYVMDGMAVNFLTHDLGEHERRMLGYLEDRLRELSRQAPAGG